MTSLIILPELSDLLSGHVVGRPDENLGMDPNLFDKLEVEEGQEVKEASEKPPKKPTRRRSQKSKKKEEEIPPAAPSTQATNVERTDAALAALGIAPAAPSTQATDVERTDAALTASGIVPAAPSVERTDAIPAEELEELTGNDSAMAISEGNMQGQMETATEPGDSSDGASMGLVDDLSDGASMRMGTEPDPSSDGASMGQLFGSDEEDSMPRGTSILKL